MQARAMSALVLAAALWSPKPAEAQVTETRMFDAELGIERPVKTLRGDALPTYMVVEAFFRQASRHLNTPSRWERFLQGLKLAPESTAAEALRDSARAAQVVLAHPLIPKKFSNAVEFLELQVEARRRRVKDLAEIYAAFMMALDRSSSSYVREELEAYLEEHVRPTIVFVMVKHPLDPFDASEAELRVMEEFDEELASVLAGNVH